MGTSPFLGGQKTDSKVQTMNSLWNERKAREASLLISACIGVMAMLGPANAPGAEGPAFAHRPVRVPVETRRALRNGPSGGGQVVKLAAAPGKGESIPTLLRSEVPGGETVAALPTYRCRRTPRPIRVDEMRDDAGWRNAESTGPFANWDAQGVPEYPTEARLAYDDRNLYVAFHCRDRDIVSPYQSRDDPLWNEDVVELFISLPEDPLQYYEFEVSPANVVFDARFRNPTGPGEQRTGGKEWNAAGLRTAVRVEGTLNQRGDTDRSWRVQMSLPFTALGLRRAPAPGTSWRVNLYRIDPSSRNRFAAWSPTLGRKPNFHRVERFGTLQFAA
jgi:hypothetical protein